MNKLSISIRALSAAFVFGLTGFTAAGQQCVLLQSEIAAINEYEEVIFKLTDSLSSHAEQAAYASGFAEGRKHARIVEQLAGEVLAAAEDAVLHASEAQYHAEVCGLDDVISYAISAESAAIDARDFAEAAYTNAKAAGKAGKLGDIWYHMRRSQQAAKDARKSSETVAYAVMDAEASCTHEDSSASGQR